MAGEEASLDKKWVSGLTLHPSVHLSSPPTFFKEMSPLFLLPTQIPQPTDDIFCHNLGWPQAHYVAQDDRELGILLPHFLNARVMSMYHDSWHDFPKRGTIPSS